MASLTEDDAVAEQLERILAAVATGGGALAWPGFAVTATAAPDAAVGAGTAGDRLRRSLGAAVVPEGPSEIVPPPAPCTVSIAVAVPAIVPDDGVRKLYDLVKSPWVTS